MKSPLSDDEYDKLESILNQFQDKNVMNLEEIDGFFTALICSPELIPPSVYLKEIWGEKGISTNNGINSAKEAQDFISLLMRHWNAVQSRLSHDEIFFPILLKDAYGNEKGNDWANGFVRGMNLDYHNWSDLFDDEKNGGALVAIFALANENNPDPEKRTYKEPVSTELREKLLAGLSVGAMKTYKYFETQRRKMARGMQRNSPIRNTIKIGRNDPCPCASGRKYKKCCGNTGLN